jgi:hypothetical protein
VEAQRTWPEELCPYFEAMGPDWQKQFFVVGLGAEPRSLSVVEVRAVLGAYSQRSEYEACREAGSMMVLKLKVLEQSRIRSVRWRDLQECHEGYCRLRSPLMSHLPCWSPVAAGGKLRLLQIPSQRIRLYPADQ